MNNIILKRIEIRQVAMKPARPLIAAHGTVAARNVILARVWDSDGVHGWGECVAFPLSGYLRETVDSAWSALRNGVLPAVHNRQFASPEALYDHLAASMPQAPVASATVEMAVWDLLARRQGRSLSNLLGGTRMNIAAGKTIGLLEEPEALGSLVAAARRTGFQRIKIKIEPKRALTSAIEAVKAADGLPVVADANASFAVSDTRRLRELDAAGLAWIEQPFATSSLRATADLRDSLATRIALDESADSLNAISRIIDVKAADAISIKPGRLGGITAALRAYRLARTAGLSLWIGGMLETGIGKAHNLALASLGGFDLIGDIGPSNEYWERDAITDPFRLVAGHIPVPEGPGIGVEADPKYLDLATVQRHLVS